MNETAQTEVKPEISFEEFSKIDLRVATVTVAEPHPNADRLLRIELPLALPQVLAGIKISAVLNVGTATLAAFIMAGGLGQLILTGVRRDDTQLILLGALLLRAHLSRSI